MHKIVYASQTARTISDDELEAILSASRRNNTECALTGMLMFFADTFLQMIEGDARSLTATYERIRADDRHRNLRLLAFAPSESRRFGEWAMGFEHPDGARLARESPGFRREGTYPLVSADLVTNATVAETLLSLYAKNQ
jgi:Sensors of blue-light using FAD